MSFVERISGFLLRPNEANQGEQDDAPLSLRLGSRILAFVGAFFCILFGLWSAVWSLITIKILCVISGILEIIVGFVVMAMEQPGCFFCIEHVKVLAEKLNERPKWHRAALYCIIAAPPIFLCFDLASFFGCGMVFGAGSLYGMMALGKKASAEDMRQAAVNSGYAGGSSTTTNDRAGIINNAQPFSFTGAVGTDSNV